MKLTPFQRIVKGLMDDGFTTSRTLTDRLNRHGHQVNETTVSKAMDAVDDCVSLDLFRKEQARRRVYDERLVDIISRLWCRCLAADCTRHGAYIPADIKLVENIVSSGRLTPEPTALDGIEMLTTITPREAKTLMTLLRYAANEPSDTDATQFQSILYKFERAFPNV